MSETLYSLEFEIFSDDGPGEPFASCVTSCVPRIGEKVSLYRETHKGYRYYRVVDIEYLFDVRNTEGQSPNHWGLQLVTVSVRHL